MKLHRDRVKDWKWGRAEELRRNLTEAEAILWQGLRRRGVGVTFHRQKIIAGWIVDFWCPRFRLAVEVDGPVHSRPLILERDKRKDRDLRSRGIRVIRFSNHQVVSDTNYVLYMIRGELRVRS